MALSTKEQELVDCVKVLLEAFQHIPVHNEVGIPKESTVGKRDVVVFTYDDWNTDYRYWLWLNNGQRELKEGTDFTLDAAAGEIGLITTGSSAFASDAELPTGQQIEASYHFKYFTDDEILAYLNLGLDAINNERPVTTYSTIDASPAEFRAALQIYAYNRCLEKLLMDNSIWRNNLIWATNFVNMTSQQFHTFMSQLWQKSWQEYEKFAKLSKSRGMVRPRGVTSGRYATQQRVTGANFQRFTVVGGSL